MSEGQNRKYFLSYSGRGLPLNLVSPIDPEGLENRNTYFRATYDSEGRLIVCEKIVYGEIELRHCYQYRAGGELAKAVVEMGGETTEIAFDSDNQPVVA